MVDITAENRASAAYGSVPAGMNGWRTEWGSCWREGESSHFLAVGFFATGFFAAGFIAAAVFFVGDFAAGFLAAGLLAPEVFFAGDFTEGFFAAGLLFAAAFLGAVLLVPVGCAATDEPGAPSRASSSFTSFFGAILR